MAKERAKAFNWIIDELPYIDQKFPSKTHDDAQMLHGGMHPDGFWRGHIDQYAHRVHILGLDTPLGRQAMMKLWATVLGAVESMIRVYGEPPPPGVPSGKIVKSLGGVGTGTDPLYLSSLEEGVFDANEQWKVED